MSGWEHYFSVPTSFGHEGGFYEKENILSNSSMNFYVKQQLGYESKDEKIYCQK